MSYKIPSLRIFGKILVEEQEGKAIRTVRLDEILPKRDAPLPAGSERLWLRFGFAFLGTEKPLIPSFVIDDVGNEEHRLRFLEWVYIDGDRFPRSEVFGYVQDFNGNWIKTQAFIRELELTHRFYTWVVDDPQAGAEAGLWVDRFGIVQAGITEPQRIKRPEDWLLPLKRSLATCWALPPEPV